MTANSTLQVLQRETFQTSRLLDFCSERELVKQIGQCAQRSSHTSPHGASL